MESIRKTVFLFLLFFVAVSLAQAENDVGRLIARGDSAYTAMNNRRAAEFYTQAMRQDTSNYEAIWKLSRAYVDMGETLKRKDERKRFFKKAEELARKAIKLNPNGSKGHLTLSIALGRVALDAGAKERVRLSKEIKSEVDKALKIDPNDDIAWHVLGRWNRKLATLSWIEKKFANMFLGGVPKDASVERAVECFQKAISLNPNYIHHYLELGLTYEKLNKKDEAKKAYQKVLDLPVTHFMDKDYKAEARQRLKKLS